MSDCHICGREVEHVRYGHPRCECAAELQQAEQQRKEANDIHFGDAIEIGLLKEQLSAAQARIAELERDCYRIIDLTWCIESPYEDPELRALKDKHYEGKPTPPDPKGRG